MNNKHARVCIQTFCCKQSFVTRTFDLLMCLVLYNTVIKILVQRPINKIQITNDFDL